MDDDFVDDLFEEPEGPEIDEDAFAARDRVAEAFAPDGFLSKKFGNYLPRTGQVEMAYAVGDAMEAGTNLVCEAPTGTGKSVAYGVPAALHAARGEQVVIVTANIALQEQLVRKDMPLLQEVLPWKFTFAIAKGLNNYLCRAAFDDSANEINVKGWPGSFDDHKQWKEVVRWTAETQTGDISELPFEPSPDVKYRFTIMSEECTGKKCPNYEGCPAMEARRLAKQASIVITNYSLFFADLAIKRGGGKGLLPAYKHVVLDEGHKTADLARGFIGWRISRGAIAYAVKLLDHKQGANAKKGPLPVINAELKEACIKAADDLFSRLSMLFHSKDYDIRFRRKWDGSLLDSAISMAAHLRSASEAYRGVKSDGLTTERVLELKNNAVRCATLATRLMSLAEFSTSDWIYFMSELNDRVTLEGQPISVAEYLRDNLFEWKDDPDTAIKSVTVTSATLCTKVDDYEFICRELGIRNAERLTVLSPFDIAKNLVLITPPMPEPNSPEFAGRMADAVVDCIRLADGRTLALFTSYKNLNIAYEAARRAELPYTLLKQGAAPRMQLIDRFKSDTKSVLFGTESFWAGVDVPGESLSCVVIDRIPFANVSDPLEDALKQKLGRGYFDERSVPRAVIEFRQGCGRLLRTETDRGLIVMLDIRMTSKGYGRTFVRSFPQGTRIARNLEEIERFLDTPSW